MGFPENIAVGLDGESEGAVRAWRHDMICKLINAGIVNPEHLKDTVSTLYEFIVSPHKKDVAEVDCVPKKNADLDIFSRQADGHRLLQQLLKQANLPKDQLECVNLFIYPPKKRSA